MWCRRSSSQSIVAINVFCLSVNESVLSECVSVYDCSRECERWEMLSNAVIENDQQMSSELFRLQWNSVDAYISSIQNQIHKNDQKRFALLHIDRCWFRQTISSCTHAGDWYCQQNLLSIVCSLSTRIYRHHPFNQNAHLIEFTIKKYYAGCLAPLNIVGECVCVCGALWYALSCVHSLFCPAQTEMRTKSHIEDKTNEILKTDFIPWVDSARARILHTYTPSQTAIDGHIQHSLFLFFSPSRFLALLNRYF